LCGATQSTPVITARDLLHGLPGEFQVVRCRGCTHCYVNPRPTPDAIGMYYPADYGPYHADESGPNVSSSSVEPGQPWYLSRPVRAVPGLRRCYYWLTRSYSTWIPPHPSTRARALELGCSDGRFLEELRGAGWDAVGVELSAEPAQRARQRGFTVHQGMLEPGMFPAGGFDACFAWMVVEHLHDPLATLREMRRLLADDGWLVFSVPNYGCWESRVFGRYWLALDVPRHLQHFRPATVRQLLRASGFRVERIIHQRNMLNLLGSAALWLRVVRPQSSLGPALIQFANHPRMWPQIALAPLAKLLAALRQGGRLTVIARPAPGIDSGALC
jgi:SAM-dependent methyltransferase